MVQSGFRTEKRPCGQGTRSSWDFSFDNMSSSVKTLSSEYWKWKKGKKILVESHRFILGKLIWMAVIPDLGLPYVKPWNGFAKKSNTTDENRIGTIYSKNKLLPNTLGMWYWNYWSSWPSNRFNIIDLPANFWVYYIRTQSYFIYIVFIFIIDFPLS